MRPLSALAVVLILLAAGRVGAQTPIRFKDWPLPPEVLKERFFRVVAPTDRNKIMRDLVEYAGEDFAFARQVMACHRAKNGRQLRGPVLGGKDFETFVLALDKDDLSRALVAAARTKTAQLKGYRETVARTGQRETLSSDALQPLVNSGSRVDRNLVIRLLSSPIERNVTLALDAIRSMAFSRGSMFDPSRDFLWSRRYKKRLVTAIEAIVARPEGPSSTAIKALELLENMGPGRLTETTLGKALKHAEPNVRYQAASTLAGWNRVQFIEPIFEALKDNPRRQKSEVMARFCDLNHKTTKPRGNRSGDPALMLPTVSYNYRITRLCNAVLNAARANPVCLRAVPYVWGNIVDELKFTARGNVRPVAGCVSDEIVFFERTDSFKGKFDAQPLDQRGRLPTRWVPLFMRHGSTGAPEVTAALEQMHRPQQPAAANSPGVAANSPGKATSSVAANSSVVGKGGFRGSLRQLWGRMRNRVGRSWLGRKLGRGRGRR